jgi:hypothetical protein
MSELIQENLDQELGPDFLSLIDHKLTIADDYVSDHEAKPNVQSLRLNPTEDYYDISRILKPKHYIQMERPIPGHEQDTKAPQLFNKGVVLVINPNAESKDDKLIVYFVDNNQIRKSKPLGLLDQTLDEKYPILGPSEAARLLEWVMTALPVK